MTELVDAAERLLHDTAKDCDAIPGHEGSCDCPAHVQSRRTADELRAVIEKIRRS